MPFAVAGCWRCVTTPAPRRPCGRAARAAARAVTTPRRGELARARTRWGAGPATCPSPTGRPRSPRPRSCPAACGASIAGDHARAACSGRASRSAPAAHSACAPVDAEARERARGRERLERVDGRAGAPGEVLEVGERLLGALVVDAVEQRVARARARSAARAAPRGSTGRRASPGRGRPTGPASAVRGSSVQSRARRVDASGPSTSHAVPDARRARSCAASRSPSAARSAARTRTRPGSGSLIHELEYTR